MSKEKITQTEQRTQAEVAPQAVKAATQKLIYIGPSLPGLKPLTSFKGGIPAKGQELISRNEKYKRLFVPMAGLINALNDIRKGGGLGEIYKNAAGERF